MASLPTLWTAYQNYERTHHLSERNLLAGSDLRRCCRAGHCIGVHRLHLAQLVNYARHMAQPEGIRRRHAGLRLLFRNWQSAMDYALKLAGNAAHHCRSWISHHQMLGQTPEDNRKRCSSAFGGDERRRIGGWPQRKARKPCRRSAMGVSPPKLKSLANLGSLRNGAEHVTKRCSLHSQRRTGFVGIRGRLARNDCGAALQRQPDVRSALQRWVC